MNTNEQPLCGFTCTLNHFNMFIKGGRTHAVFARALLLMQFSMHIRIAKTNMPLIQRSFYLPDLSLLFFFVIERSVLMVKVFITKTQRTQQFLDFYRKNAFKYSGCAVARKIETDCFCRNVPISNDPVVRISRNLAKKNSSETM